MKTMDHASKPLPEVGNVIRFRTGDFPNRRWRGWGGYLWHSKTGSGWMPPHMLKYVELLQADPINSLNFM